MKTSIRIIHWAPRILCILAILFLGLFALDSFDPKYTFWQQLQGFFIHLIPNFILIIFLIIAWKWELIGGLIFMAVGLGFTPFIFSGNYEHNHSFWVSLSIVLAITFPFILTGALFILSHFLKKKNQAYKK